MYVWMCVCMYVYYICLYAWRMDVYVCMRVFVYMFSLYSVRAASTAKRCEYFCSGGLSTYETGNPNNLMYC